MWDGHLNAVTALLNLFAATGDIHYAKSARLYVQEMRKLSSTHPWLHQKFVEGYHTVRRSERLCTGLWTDIVIEKVLMRSLKSRGGLGHHVEVSRGKANTLIVSSALEFARNGQTVTVVAEDTDVLIMLVYHWRNDMEDIFIRKESRLSRPGEMISMKEATSSIAVVIQRHILLIHACSGCDTTSATFGHGKMHLMKMLNWVPEVQNLSPIVSDRDAPADEVGYAGLRVFACSMLELRRIH